LFAFGTRGEGVRPEPAVEHGHLPRVEVLGGVDGLGVGLVPQIRLADARGEQHGQHEGWAHEGTEEQRGEPHSPRAFSSSVSVRNQTT
jgi:hypothetical protein